MNTIRFHSDRRAYLAAMAMLIGSSLSAPSAQAAYIVTLAQEGPNVVATGSGTLDLAALSVFATPGNASPYIDPSIGYISTGAETLASFYHGNTGPMSFGSGSGIFANNGSGDTVGIYGNVTEEYLWVPSTYTSGNPLSDTATYDNQTFTSLGVISGTYVWTWGSGANADRFTLQIGAVPAPLIGHGLPVLLAVGGVLFGAKLLERSKRHRLQIG
jgi:hypothetical protein